MNKNGKDLIYLAACAVRQTVPEGIDAMDVDGVLKEAERQSLAAAAACALAAAGVSDARIHVIIAKAMQKDAAMETTKTQVLEALEDAGIWYMPLKGSVLKKYYPETWIRQMSDCDVLFDSARAEDVRQIMEGLGFTTVSFNTGMNHDGYQKKPIYSVEMHRTLIQEYGEDGALNSYHHAVDFQYYKNVKERLIRDEDRQFGYHFTPEDFYIFMIAHEYNHFTRRGTGFRSLLDVYVFLRAFGETLDWDYIRRETDKLDLTDFETRNRKIALHIFDGGQLSAEDEEMLELMADAGTYGRYELRFRNGVRFAGGGKLRYAFKRIVLPMDVVEQLFPFFYRHKALLPFLPFYRLVKAARKDRPTIGMELKALYKMKLKQRK